MKKGIIKYSSKEKIEIILFTVALIIIFMPLLLFLALCLMPSDVCLWNEGGTCPFCGY